MRYVEKQIELVPNVFVFPSKLEPCASHLLDKEWIFQLVLKYYVPKSNLFNEATENVGFMVVLRKPSQPTELKVQDSHQPDLSSHLTRGVIWPLSESSDTRYPMATGRVV